MELAAWGFGRPRGGCQAPELGVRALAHLLDQVQDDGAQVPAVLGGHPALPLVAGAALDDLLDVGQFGAAAQLRRDGLEPR